MSSGLSLSRMVPRGCVPAGWAGLFFLVSRAPDLTALPPPLRPSPSPPPSCCAAARSTRVGLHIWPQYHPDYNSPCSSVWWGVSAWPQQTVFANFTTYKNGLKGATARSLGFVQWANFTAADNGGGLELSRVFGKDNQAGLEVARVIDIRNRALLPLSQLPGLFGAVVVARTAEGRVGTAGYWPGSTNVRGIITQSSENWWYGSPLAVVNATLVGFTGAGYAALEACGQCQFAQGGWTTSFANVTVSPAPGPTAGKNTQLAAFSYPFQGVFHDTDGTLLGAGAGAQLMAANALLAVDGCNYTVPGVSLGALCRPGLVQRRVGVNSIQPGNSLPLAVTKSGVTALVPMSPYNAWGYGLHVTAGQNTPYELAIGSSTVWYDMTYAQIYGVEAATPAQGLVLGNRQSVLMDHFNMNFNGITGAYSANASVNATSAYGSYSYNRTFTPQLGYPNVQTSLVTFALPGGVAYGMSATTAISPFITFQRFQV